MHFIFQLQQSPTMEMGTIGKWLCKAGDGIKAGDSLADIETDKASMAFEVSIVCLFVVYCLMNHSLCMVDFVVYTYFHFMTPHFIINSPFICMNSQLITSSPNIHHVARLKMISSLPKFCKTQDKRLQLELLS